MAKALIVGAGLGGLSTALRLAKKGYQVSIVEKYKQAGGQLNQIRKNGFVWDLGPTYLSMSYIFEDLSKDCDIDLPFKLIELDKLY
ncbi:MAG: FAD-dependent oxidoreductase, partial [Bacteroidetes bacterium]|nr:FAD-dependent oxidoreductase [Bacteroidota bacterium]